MATTTQQSSDLKYFGFINTYSDKAYGLSNSYYTWGKQQLPAQVKTQVDSTEKRVTDIGDPYVKQLLGVYDNVIHEADKRLDFLVHKTNELQGNVQKQRDVIVKQISEQVDKIKAQYPGITKNVETQLDNVRSIPNVLSERRKQAQARLMESWNQLLKDPRVQGIIERAKPQIEQTQKFLTDTQAKILHDTRYADFYGFIAQSAKQIQANEYFKAVEGRVTPVVYTYASKVVSPEDQSKIKHTFHKNTTPRTNQPIPVETQK